MKVCSTRYISGLPVGRTVLEMKQMSTKAFLNKKWLSVFLCLFDCALREEFGLCHANSFELLYIACPTPRLGSGELSLDGYPQPPRIPEVVCFAKYQDALLSNGLLPSDSSGGPVDRPEFYPQLNLRFSYSK
jgi:hypothetical protein